MKAPRNVNETREVRFGLTELEAKAVMEACDDYQTEIANPRTGHDDPNVSRAIRKIGTALTAPPAETNSFLDNLESTARAAMNLTGSNPAIRLPRIHVDPAAILKLVSICRELRGERVP